jgi:YD repeat-containing protein
MRAGSPPSSDRIHRPPTIYLDNNWLQRVAFGNGSSTTYDYYDNGWLKEISNFHGETVPSRVLTYAYDAAGRITQVVETGVDAANPSTTTYILRSPREADQRESDWIRRIRYVHVFG